MGKVEETKEKIIQATIKLAIQGGFANIRTAAIAAEAGVSEGLLFKYFPSKSHLFAIIINENFQHLKDGVENIIKDKGVSPTQKMNNMINFHFKFFVKDRNLVQLLFGHSDRKSLDINFDAIFEHGLRPYTQLIVKILNEGMETGEFRRVNPYVVAVAIIGTMQVVMVNTLMMGSVFSLEEAQQNVLDYIMAAIKA